MPFHDSIKMRHSNYWMPIHVSIKDGQIKKKREKTSFSLLVSVLMYVSLQEISDISGWCQTDVTLKYTTAISHDQQNIQMAVFLFAFFLFFFFVFLLILIQRCVDSVYKVKRDNGFKNDTFFFKFYKIWGTLFHKF